MRRKPRAAPGSSALLSLQRGLTGKRELAGSAYMDDPAYRAAYADYYRAVSMAQMARIVTLSGIAPRSVLDMGAGPGSVSLELLARGAGDFSLVDTSVAVLELAASSIRTAAARLGIAASIGTSVADLEAPGAFPSRAFDLVAFGHCLNEIGEGPDGVARRLAVIRRSAAVIAPGGAALVLEPATLAASRDALLLRDALVADGWSVQAPCTWAGACPALQAAPSHTCHDESSWGMPTHVGELAQNLGLDRELIKMTWLLMQPPAANQEGVEPPGSGAWRVVSDPLLNKAGRVRYLLCGPGGRFPFSARNGDEVATGGGFFSLRRYDLIQVDNPEPREGGWGFGPKTTIRVFGSPGSLARGGRSGLE